MSPTLASSPNLRGPALAGLLSLAGFVAGFGAWSMLAPLSEAALATGSIQAEGHRRVVQHLEGGIVAEILVRDGDRVRAGQPLARLATVRSASEAEALRGLRQASIGHLARLEAELAGATRIDFPAELTATEVMTGQAALFASRAAAFATQEMVLAARLPQHAAALDGARAQQASQGRQLHLLRQEVADVEGLLRQGLERMPRLRALQRQVAATEGAMRELDAQAARTVAMRDETLGELRRLREQRQQEIGAEAVTVRDRLREVEERLRPADDASARREILAPEDGVVLGSRFFNAGAVLRPGDTLLEIVPARDRLVAELRVAPTDIDAVRVGLSATLRLPAYKARLVPWLDAEITFVGGDVTEDPQRGQGFYRARAVIDAAQLALLDGVELRAGMPVEAQIRIGQRSLLRYVLQPLIDSFHRAFREA